MEQQWPEQTANARLSPRRRRWDSSLLRVGLMVVLLVLVGAGLLYSRVHMRRAALLAAQQACMTYQRPANEVVYEENAERAAALLERKEGYQAVPIGTTGDAPAAGRVAPVWSALKRWAVPSAPEPRDPILFLHDRRAADGERGIVCVEVDRAARRLRISFVHPGGVTVNPSLSTDLHLAPPPQEGLIVLSAGPDPLAARLPRPDDDAAGSRADLRFFAGRADSNDGSHFTLPYESDGLRGEIDMWIQSDDTVYYVDRLYAAH